jgi:hypothetical protein
MIFIHHNTRKEIKKESLLLAIFFLLSFTLSAQNQPLEKIYREHLHIHLNNTFFITGETLLFSVHCHTSDDHRISALSSLAYLELVGENQKPAFQIKVPLVNGIGSADYFLPATLPAGNYTLVAYTKWMKNFPLREFSRQIITVINPFLKADEVTGRKTTLSDVGEKSTSTIPATDIIKLTVPREKLQLREKISVSIKNADSLEQVTLSINVRLIDKKFTPQESLTNVEETHPGHSLEVNNEIRHLPDFRGELISGKVVNKTTRQPLAHTVVHLSAPSKNFIFKIARTDSLGRFFFSIENSGASTAPLLRLASVDHREFEIQRTPEFLDDYGYFSPPPLVIDTSFRKTIERRNLYSQIENAYYEVKKDSIAVSSHAKPFFGKPDKIYMLDEYARFATMEDVFREYIPEIVVKKKNEKFELQLVSSLSSIRLTGAPLILLDGIPVHDADIIMKYNPLNIQRIEIVARRYFYSALQTDGIISLETYEGNAKELSVSEMIPLTYILPQPAKIYFTPSYPEKGFVRIPDYRTQLFWKSAFTMTKKSEQRIDFFTSDVTGNFIISVEGFTTDGRYFKTEESIEVVNERQ